MDTPVESKFLELITGMIFDTKEEAITQSIESSIENLNAIVSELPGKKANLLRFDGDLDSISKAYFDCVEAFANRAIVEYKISKPKKKKL